MLDASRSRWATTRPSRAGRRRKATCRRRGSSSIAVAVVGRGGRSPVAALCLGSSSGSGSKGSWWGAIWSWLFKGDLRGATMGLRSRSGGCGAPPRPPVGCRCPLSVVRGSWFVVRRCASRSGLYSRAPSMTRVLSKLAWLVVALSGAGALGAIALSRGEPVNGLFFVVAAGGTYLVAYRFYSAFIAARVLALDATRATPAERLDDGRDFVPTNQWVVLGHHFAAIAGPGPLVGPTLAAQFGYLPGTLWLVAGAVLGGCVQDFVILFFSLRRDGRSLGQIAKRRGGPARGPADDGVGARDHDHPARGGGARGGERAQALALGRLHARDDDPDRAADGRLHALPAARARDGGLGDRPRARAVRGGRGPVGRALAELGAGLHAHRPGARARGDRLRLRRLGAAGVAAARAARLPVGLHQGGRRARARPRHPAGAADAPDAGAHPLHRRQRPGLRGRAVPLLLHHDRLRRRSPASTRSSPRARRRSC